MEDFGVCQLFFSSLTQLSAVQLQHGRLIPFFSHACSKNKNLYILSSSMQLPYFLLIQSYYIFIWKLLYDTMNLDVKIGKHFQISVKIFKNEQSTARERWALKSTPSVEALSYPDFDRAKRERRRRKKSAHTYVEIYLAPNVDMCHWTGTRAHLQLDAALQFVPLRIYSKEGARWHREEERGGPQ